MAGSSQTGAGYDSSGRRGRTGGPHGGNGLRQGRTPSHGPGATCRLQTPGSSLTIQSSAAKVLHEFGARQALEENSYESDSMTWWSYKEDEPLAVVPAGRISKTPRHLTERPVAQKIIYAVAIENGVRVLFGKNAVRLEDHEARPKVWTEDGELYTADLVVGADGKETLFQRWGGPTRRGRRRGGGG